MALEPVCTFHILFIYSAATSLITETYCQITDILKFHKKKITFHKGLGYIFMGFFIKGSFRDFLFAFPNKEALWSIRIRKQFACTECVFIFKSMKTIKTFITSIFGWQCDLNHLTQEKHEKIAFFIPKGFACQKRKQHFKIIRLS